MLCLFSVNLEVSIVSTALIAIANDLDGFDQTGWVVTGYLLTYTGKSEIHASTRIVDNRFPLHEANQI